MKKINLVFLITMLIIISSSFVASTVTNSIDDYSASWWEKLLSPGKFALSGDTFLNPGAIGDYTFILDYNTVCAGVKDTDVYWTVEILDWKTGDGNPVNQIDADRTTDNLIMGSWAAKAKIQFVKAGEYIVNANYQCNKGSGTNSFTVKVRDSCSSECDRGEVRCINKYSSRQSCNWLSDCGTWGSVIDCNYNEICVESGSKATCQKFATDKCSPDEIKCVDHFNYQKCEYKGGVWLWSGAISLDPINRICKNDQTYPGECVDDNECNSDELCDDLYCEDKPTAPPVIDPEVECSSAIDCVGGEKDNDCEGFWKCYESDCFWMCDDVGQDTCNTNLECQKLCDGQYRQLSICSDGSCSTDGTITCDKDCGASCVSSDDCASNEKCTSSCTCEDISTICKATEKVDAETGECSFSLEYFFKEYGTKIIIGFLLIISMIIITALVFKRKGA